MQLVEAIIKGTSCLEVGRGEGDTQKSLYVNNPSKARGLGTREANFTPEVA